MKADVIMATPKKANLSDFADVIGRMNDKLSSLKIIVNENSEYVAKIKDYRNNGIDESSDCGLKNINVISSLECIVSIIDDILVVSQETNQSLKRLII